MPFWNNTDDEDARQGRGDDQGSSFWSFLKTIGIALLAVVAIVTGLALFNNKTANWIDEKTKGKDGKGWATGAREGLGLSAPTPPAPPTVAETLSEEASSAAGSVARGAAYTMGGAAVINAGAAVGSRIFGKGELAWHGPEALLGSARTAPLRAPVAAAGMVKGAIDGVRNGAPEPRSIPTNDLVETPPPGATRLGIEATKNGETAIFKNRLGAALNGYESTRIAYQTTDGKIVYTAMEPGVFSRNAAAAQAGVTSAIDGTKKAAAVVRDLPAQTRVMLTPDYPNRTVAKAWVEDYLDFATKPDRVNATDLPAETKARIIETGRALKSDVTAREALIRETAGNISEHLKKPGATLDNMALDTVSNTAIRQQTARTTTPTVTPTVSSDSPDTPRSASPSTADGTDSPRTATASTAVETTENPSRTVQHSAEPRNPDRAAAHHHRTGAGGTAGEPALAPVGAPTSTATATPVGTTPPAQAVGTTPTTPPAGITPPTSPDTATPNPSNAIDTGGPAHAGSTHTERAPAAPPEPHSNKPAVHGASRYASATNVGAGAAGLGLGAVGLVNSIESGDGVGATIAGANATTGAGVITVAALETAGKAVAPAVKGALTKAAVPLIVVDGAWQVIKEEGVGHKAERAAAVGLTTTAALGTGALLTGGLVVGGVAATGAAAGAAAAAAVAVPVVAAVAVGVAADRIIDTSRTYESIDQSFQPDQKRFSNVAGATAMLTNTGNRRGMPEELKWVRGIEDFGGVRSADGKFDMTNPKNQTAFREAINTRISEIDSWKEENQRSWYNPRRWVNNRYVQFTSAGAERITTIENVNIERRQLASALAEFDGAMANAQERKADAQARVRQAEEQMRAAQAQAAQPAAAAADNTNQPRTIATGSQLTPSMTPAAENPYAKNLGRIGTS